MQSLWALRIELLALILGVVTFTPSSRAAAQESPVTLNLCAVNNAAEGPARDSDFRFSAADPTEEFRPSVSGCGGILDGIFGSNRWGRAAGTAVEASRLMFGVDMDVRKFVEFARRLGLAPQGSDRSTQNAPSSETDEFETKTFRSLFLRASRKHFFIGFKIAW